MSGVVNKSDTNYLDKIDQWITNNQEEIFAFNRSLVSIPSQNRYPTGEEKEVQQLVEKTLKELGCDTDVFLPTDVPGLVAHPAYLGERFYDDRPNVVGTKKGTGNGKSIIFSGHMDTVPEGDDPWSVDPFAGEIKDGKQYGLGLFDMKGGMAASMMALKLLNELGIRLKGDVIIESVVDEEYGGANGTLACRLRGYEADIAIVPEPSNMIVCPAAQGGSMFRITFQGRAGRSFSGEKLLNPVYPAARFIEIFRQFEEIRSQAIPNSKYYKQNPGLPTYIQGLKAGPINLPLCDRVPSECTLDVWFQCYPGTTEEELREEFEAFILEQSKEDELLRMMPPKIQKLIRFLPGTSIPENHGILDVVKEVSEESKEELLIDGAPFACDSFMFNMYSNTPAIIWGPKGGNAHAPDEFIYVNDFKKLIKLYALTIIKWCGVEE
ncbi:M20/M25/M40 family metallo-hydrolase [Fredinandcohnia sp. QZ13]|uniref:M20/M25/M40 family metallo-hydrolase n=1 Tax=Fredinandcohnia sp. QZ13 TaxID=3073144 RepID=UPI0028535E85|nr:M20/M25/M40 family metallo-hydrolase [Fredinandcohnia sp. QZ13]MDR4887499.1 M20/M25/M40 family metallo-hydrolase [Fredinandcohnia sp. QZ13]